jgi:hypothetical protein
MARKLTMVLVASFLFLSPAGATLTPQKDRLISDKARQITPKVESSTPEENDDGKLVISDDTEVQLDGKESKLEDVPKTAEVILMELGKDKKSVLKIHFRTKK